MHCKVYHVPEGHESGTQTIYEIESDNDWYFLEFSGRHTPEDIQDVLTHVKGGLPYCTSTPEEVGSALEVSQLIHEQ